MGDFLSAGGAALDELLRLRGLPSNNTAHQVHHVDSTITQLLVSIPVPRQGSRSWKKWPFPEAHLGAMADGDRQTGLASLYGI